MSVFKDLLKTVQALTAIHERLGKVDTEIARLAEEQVRLRERVAQLEMLAGLVRNRLLPPHGMERGSP